MHIIMAAVAEDFAAEPTLLSSSSSLNDLLLSAAETLPLAAEAFRRKTSSSQASECLRGGYSTGHFAAFVLTPLAAQEHKQVPSSAALPSLAAAAAAPPPAAGAPAAAAASGAVSAALAVSAAVAAASAAAAQRAPAACGSAAVAVDNPRDEERRRSSRLSSSGFDDTPLHWQPAASSHAFPLLWGAAGAAAAAAAASAAAPTRIPQLQQQQQQSAAAVGNFAATEQTTASLASPTSGEGRSKAAAPGGALPTGESPPARAAAPGGDGSSRRSSDTQQQQRSVKEILDYAAGQAFRGGIAGASAQVLNVFMFMWLRTTMNYQYRYGKSTLGAIKTLYAEGGVVRFYRGLLPALMQSPLSRFGDTAANVGVLAALDSKPATRDLPVGVKTALASCGAAAWRFFLMPIDAWKTTKQVEGGSGLRILTHKVRHHGFSKLYHGSVAAMGATWVGHYPWFFVHNYLSEKLPQFDGVPQGRHVRYGFIGFVSSVVSDTCSNSIRVLKTTKQTSVEPMTYPQALREVLAKDGVTGLLFRGLGTRILTNGLQGMVFSVGWKAIQSHLSK